MKKPKIKKRRHYWIVRADRRNVVKCYSLDAARLWYNVFGGGEKT